ncbi:chromosome partitioning protein [Caulobacter ginsengisoli]|uniref:Chromosome partitioning protein n=1 Tax=Caulobacter ginsengisoli TaxID=400775 RepID=A0ABU0IQ90_9CAUL|nr:division plane positioning ATPase MipZ [Caulobacter ginsengisoli]MDQ0464182.1 chromosome partitioning protein [Caulobacter ginsengisoli]
MRRLVLLSRKGGTGKTTLSVNLAVAAVRDGLNVAVADLDPQSSACRWGDVRTSQQPSIRAVNSGTLFPYANNVERLGADLLIIDTPAGDTAAGQAAIGIADLCVLITRPSYFDLEALAWAAEAVRARGKPGLIVLNQAPSPRGGVESPVIHRSADAARKLGLPLARVGLRARVAFQDSLWRGEGVLEFDHRSAAAEEVRRLWAEVSGLLDAQAVPRPRAALA